VIALEGRTVRGRGHRRPRRLRITTERPYTLKGVGSVPPPAVDLTPTERESSWRRRRRRRVYYDTDRCDR